MADPEDGLMNGEHLDEGVVHAWLDGQLAAADAARIESHIAGCADCAAMVAEARGFVAASSRILTGLDGVPARVVPRSRSRAGIWQVRAAAAVIVVALGAAAVLSDPGGRLAQLRHDTGVPQPAAVASQAPARARATDSAAPARVAPASPSFTRTMTPAPVPQQKNPPQENKPQENKPEENNSQENEPRAREAGDTPKDKSQDGKQDSKKETALNERDALAGTGAMQAGAMRKAAQLPPSNTVRPSSAAAQAVTNGAPSVPPVRQDTLIAAAPAASRSMLAAKAAPSAVESYMMHQPLADSAARANTANVFDVRRLASNAAYRRCAGKVVTVSGLVATSGGAAPQSTIVRLDSVAQRPPRRGFVVAAPGGNGSLDGWWVPVGTDSALVMLANAKPVPGADSASTDASSAETAGVISATVTRVQCQSP